MLQRPVFSAPLLVVGGGGEIASSSGPVFIPRGNADPRLLPAATSLGQLFFFLSQRLHPAAVVRRSAAVACS
jgi:hypothetical protein